MKNKARYAVVVIFVINILNYTDRYILPAVLPKIHKEFGLNIFQQGLLGTSFILVYALAGLPLGILADKTVRKNIISVSVTVWSLLTLSIGFAQNFFQLLFIRSALGLGEAGYSPASLTILGDYASVKNRGKILSFFSAGNLIGVSFGYIIGGLIAHALGWRYAFYIVGIPGMLFAIFAFYIHEPERKTPIKEVLNKPKLIDSLKALRVIPTFWLVVLIYIAITFAVGGTSFWLPSYVVSMFHISIERATSIGGVILLISGSVGVIGGGWVSDTLYRVKEYNRFVVPIIGCCVGTIAVAIAFFTHDLLLFFCMTFVASLFLSSTTGPLYVIVHDVISPHIRSTAFGLSFLLAHLLGDASAPSVIGWIGDRSSLEFGLIISVTSLLTIASILCILGTRYIKKDSIALSL